MTDLGPGAITALVVAALLVGFAKTAVGSLGSVSVAIFAAVLPARESTGVLLPLLMVGDVMAVSVYRRHADWPTLVRLVPSVAVGVVLGAVFVAFVDDTVMRRTIGATLLALLVVHVVVRRRSSGEEAPRSGLRRHLLAGFFGTLAGFTTMVANAGGSVMTLYLLSAGFAMMGFLGTAAWFFAVVNAFKVPFSVGLGLITWESLLLDLWFVPAVLVGGLIGRRVIARIDNAVFDKVVLWGTVFPAAWLLR